MKPMHKRRYEKELNSQALFRVITVFFSPSQVLCNTELLGY